MSELRKTTPELQINNCNVEGLQISEAVWGHGDTQILALHGWIQTGNEELLPFIQSLDPDKYTIYMPNFPGFNKSQEPNISWGVSDYADFSTAYLRHHKIDKPVNLIGHSFGGRVSILLGAHNPSLVNKIILIDSAGIKPKKPIRSELRLMSYKTTRIILEKIGLHSTANSLREWYSDKYGSKDYKNVSGTMKQTFIKVINQDLKKDAKKIKVPTLLIWGSEDQETPLSDAKILEKIIPDAGLVVFNGAGHFSYLEHTAETVKITEHFLTHN